MSIEKLRTEAKELHRQVIDQLSKAVLKTTETPANMSEIRLAYLRAADVSNLNVEALQVVIRDLKTQLKMDLI